MKVCVFGAGAIGGMLAVRLAQAGAGVSCIARGAHLKAMQDDGLTLISGGERHTVRIPCVGDAAALGPQDYVLITLKAPALPAAAAMMQPLFGPDTALVAALNGVPWWYFYRHGGPLDGLRLRSTDPEGDLDRLLEPRRALGCIVYPACEVVQPGVIAHSHGDRFLLGEPDGSHSPRVEAFAALMARAGFQCPVRPRIRDDIWLKLWGNLAFNPISALTLGTLAQISADPGTRQVARAMMLEAQALAESLGVHFPMPVDKRIDGAGEVGAHKTSMLQDLERGRPMEIDAILGAVVEIGQRLNRLMPACETVLGLVRQRARLAGCY